MYVCSNQIIKLYTLMYLSLRKVALAFVAVLLAHSANAQQAASELKYNFVVWLHDGGQVTLPMDEHPVVTYSDGNIVVSTTDSRIEYAHTAVNKFTIEEVEPLPDVPTPDPEPEPTPDPAPEFYFVVWMHGGARISFPLTEHPVMTYADGDIVVTTSQEQLTYAHADVRKFTLADEDISQDEPTKIEPSERDAQWQRQGDVMLFSACTPGERVAVYNATGQLVTQYVISADGTLQIPLSQFGEGMYIVKTESITYKFIKK